MGWLDKLLGREKKATDDVMGDNSMKQEGMHEEGMASEHAESAGNTAQEARDESAEQVERHDS